MNQFTLEAILLENEDKSAGQLMDGSDAGLMLRWQKSLFTGETSKTEIQNRFEIKHSRIVIL